MKTAFPPKLEQSEARAIRRIRTANPTDGSRLALLQLRGKEKARGRRRLVAWLLEQLYDQIAWAYDPVSWLISGGRWRDWQRAALPYLKYHRVLEVGPGTGHLLSELAARGHEVVAVDRSAPMCRTSAARLRWRGASGWVVGGDTRWLPFADEAFDALVYTFPTPVVREESFWREAARVVRPDGRIVLVEGASSDTKVWPGLLERAWSLALGRKGRYQSPIDLPIAVPDALGLHVRRIVTHGPEGIVWLVIAVFPL